MNSQIHNHIINAKGALERGEMQIALDELKNGIGILRENDFDEDIIKLLSQEFTLCSGRYHTLVRERRLGTIDFSSI